MPGCLPVLLLRPTRDASRSVALAGSTKGVPGYCHCSLLNLCLITDHAFAPARSCPGCAAELQHAGYPAQKPAPGQRHPLPPAPLLTCDSRPLAAGPCCCCIGIRTWAVRLPSLLSRARNRCCNIRCSCSINICTIAATCDGAWVCGHLVLPGC
jgi:hypothetical protein